MFFSSSQDVLFLVGSVCLIGVSGFLMWALYEWARLGKQTNELVEESREKLEVLEGSFDDLIEQVQGITRLLGSVSSIAQGIFGFFQGKEGRERSSSRGTRRSDELRRIREDLDALED